MRFGQNLLKKCSKSFKILFTNDIDHGAYIADTLRADTPIKTREEAWFEIYKVMRPGEPHQHFETAEKLLLNQCSLAKSNVTTCLMWVVRKFERRLGREFIDTDDMDVQTRTRCFIQSRYR